jgi:hypothetical protein
MARARVEPGKKAHPGFAGAAKSVSAKEGVPLDNAKAIIAAGARKASASAKKANPRLKRVKGA